MFRIQTFALTLLASTSVFSQTVEREPAEKTNGRIAWTLIAPTGSGIYSIGPTGLDLVQLTFPASAFDNDTHPDWSPDGSKIIFGRGFDDGTEQIFRINANGSGLTQIGDCSGDCLADDFPSYSPDGKRIAFIRFIGPVRADNNATSGGVWIMNADGSHPVQITQLDLPTVSENYAPSWSPDGRKLVFTEFNTVAQPVGRQAVFVAKVDGSAMHRITPWALDATEADWSPDGTRILVTSHHDVVQPGREQLYMVHPDGSHLVKVVPAGLAEPDNIGGKFSPDGKKIVFRHQIDYAIGDPDSQAYTMNVDGSNVRQLSFEFGFVDAPNWGTRR